MTAAAKTLHHLRAEGGVLAARPSPIRIPRLGRNDLPSLCHQLGFQRGAEIGVWKGAFSEKLCLKNPLLKELLCVDPWVSYPAWLDTKNTLPQEQAERFMAKAYEEARTRLAPLSRCTLIRDFSVEAAKQVPDGSLDFIYIDANHTREAVTADLIAWTPKVRAGGFCAGHDYRMFPNKPTIHVIEAVQDFTAAHGIDPWFVLAADRTPSWLWVAR